MVTLSSTRIASEYCQVNVGGDVAVLKGIMKLVLDAHEAALRAGDAPVLDLAFIEQHTMGLDALIEDLRRTRWEDILRVSGVERAQIERMAAVYMGAKSAIICYGMGITQHRRGTETVQQIANLLLLRGNFGRPGAGICPVRGHSNVQGDRTVGIDEKPSAELLGNIEKVFGFRPPQKSRPFRGGFSLQGDDRRPVRGVRRPGREFRRPRPPTRRSPGRRCGG